MSEEETKQENKETDKTDTEGDADKGDKPSTMSKLDQADAKIKRLEELDKSLGEKIDKLDDIKASDLLGGSADAGSGEVKKEETNQEYVDRMRKSGWRADEKTN